MTSRGRPPAEAGAARPGARRPVPLVGRQHELSALARVLDHARSGGFRVALIEGDAGLGKTRLAEEALATFAHPAIHLSARSYRWGATTSFGAWLEALDRHLRELDEQDLRALVEHRAGELASILPPLESVVGPAAPDPARIDRGRLLEGFVDLFDRLSARDPVLVVLDDVHLADASSWEALRYLQRRLSGARIAVLLTARPAELARSPIAAEVLLGLDQDGALERIGLGALSPPEVTELAHAALRADPRSQSSFVPAALVSWLLDRSRGHPLFVIGLLEALVAEGADFAAPRLERLPTALEERISLDLRDLGREERELIELLAVFDGRVDHRLLAAASELSERALGRHLESLVWRRLVTEREQGRALLVEIAHPVIQEAVYGEIGLARRRGLHRTAARVLEADGQAGSAAGHHARAAGPGDDHAVAALCRAIADAEGRGLVQEILAIHRALLEILPPADGRWREVYVATDTHAEWVLSHLAENDADTAIEVAERMAAHVEGDPSASASVSLRLAAFLSFGAGRLDEAVREAEAAVERFELAGEQESMLLARNELAWIRGCAGDLATQARLAEEVLGSAEERGFGHAAVQAASTAAYALGLHGRTERAGALYDRSIRLARTNDNPYRVAWGLAQRGCMLSLAGRLDDAHRSVEEALATDDRAPDAIALEDLAQVHWLAGRIDEAIDSLEHSAARRPVGGSRRRAWGRALAARLHLERAEPGRAEAALTQAETTYGGRGFLVWGWWPRWTRALLQWHEHDLADAAATLDRAARELSATGAAGYEALVLAELAEIGTDLPARPWSEDAAARLAALDGDGQLLPALATLGAAHAALAAGRATDAAKHAADAAERLEPLGYRLHAASAHHTRGRALATDARAEAVDALKRAAADFDACGAVWRRDRVLADLTRLGTRGQRAARTVAGPASLTPREREVAALAADGLTSREIAERLFIGRRTVESHLASCYAKLGVGSKRELARRSDELDLGTRDNAP
jgi:DNA-binding CsgD family transcriptional regulator/tetratricopeptide (TPR) repeat protein